MANESVAGASPLDRARAIDLSKISNLTYSCRAWVEPASGKAGGVISFAGKYGIGSAGENDALFISWRLKEFCEIKNPVAIRGLVVDFRALKYEWGEDLYVSPYLLRPEGPILVVVTPAARSAFAGVLETGQIMTDFDEAVRQVDTFLKGGVGHGSRI